ncbi:MULTISPECIES: CrcB family protein [unclassified Bacillus (in: firmicutes)]|uniref:fluoride efflux transporter FluC n=1 Tax=unclassified Bacillus (in: firmicutes) TaxID=185979 RepID=UPI000B89B22C|nr:MULTISPECIES: CrcB family protein [unclassified Bacillus (in: firmicutes)]
MNLAMISIGGFLGAVSRFTLSSYVKKKKPSAFPVGTLLINLLGSFLLGILVGIRTEGLLYSLFGIGFMGAFTTFSTFQLEGYQLKKKELGKLFYLYLILSYGGGLLLAYMGIIMGRGK